LRQGATDQKRERGRSRHQNPHRLLHNQPNLPVKKWKIHARLGASTPYSGVEAPKKGRNCARTPFGVKELMNSALLIRLPSSSFP
jgi:hypothetical protein